MSEKCFSILIEDINPPSVNTYWRSTCRNNYPVVYLSKKGKMFKESLSLLIQNKMKKDNFFIIDNRCKLEIKYYYKGKRHKDIDNILKVLIDSLNGILIKDDSQIVKLKVSKFRAKKNMIYIKILEQSNKKKL